MTVVLPLPKASVSQRTRREFSGSASTGRSEYQCVILGPQRRRNCMRYNESPAISEKTATHQHEHTLEGVQRAGERRQRVGVEARRAFAYNELLRDCVNTRARAVCGYHLLAVYRTMGA